MIKEKVFSMFTDPSHIRVSDPGKVEGNVVFTYLDAFCENKEEVESLKQQYRKGGLGDIKIKAFLNDVLQNLLKPIREKRESLSKKELLEICRAGTEKALKIAESTLREVKEAIGINIFN